MSAYWSIMGQDLVQQQGENREGAEAIKLLKVTIDKYRKGNVLDFGCGKGRLAKLVAPLNYLGFDINSTMLQQAQTDMREYSFTHSLDEALSYGADVTLLYTVISMWPDYEARNILARIHSRIIIIGEIADRRWASAGYAVPPIYNRDVEQIDELLALTGYRQIDHVKALHERYQTWNNEYDKHMHILVYSNDNAG